MQTAKREIAVSMTDISKRFGPVRALENANLEIARGSILGLVGQNGAGKSTIIKVLAGIVKPDSGTIVINGETVSTLTPASACRRSRH